MKVLMVNEVCGVTSTGRICTDIADILTEKGHTCRVAYAHGRHEQAVKSEKYGIKIGNKADVYGHALLSRIFDNAGFWSKMATRDFVKEIEKYDPDIIHLHNLHGYYINIEILFDYLKRADKPVLWTLHDCWSFTGHCTCYDFYKCDKWMTGCYECKLKGEYPASIWADNSKNNYARKKSAFTNIKNLKIVTPSRWLKSQVKKSFLKDYEVLVINNGIDTSMFVPQRSEFKSKYGIEGKVVLLGVANVWTTNKGLKDFYELASRLEEKYKIVMVGDMRNNKCPSNIIHIQHTNSIEEMAQIYSAADVFLNLTYEDTYPTTNLESISCGTPVVTYRTGGSPEALNENRGIVVAQGDIDAIVSAIDKALNLKVLPTKEFEKKTRFEEYIQLYEEMVK